MSGKGDRPRNTGPEFKKNFDGIFGDRCRLNHIHTVECSTTLDNQEVQDEGQTPDTTDNQAA